MAAENGYCYAEACGYSLRCAYRWLARFRQVGHRITGDRQQGRSYGVGYDKVHVAVDAGVNGDRRCQPRDRLVQRPGDRVPAGYERQRPCLLLQAVRQSLRHARPQGHPHQALHAEKQRQGGALWPPADFVYIQTLCRKWAYAMPFQNSQEGNRWLPRYLSLYNRLRKHSALGWRSHRQRLHELLRSRTW
jgi:hypothetical protein